MKPVRVQSSLGRSRMFSVLFCMPVRAGLNICKLLIQYFGVYNADFGENSTRDMQSACYQKLEVIDLTIRQDMPRSHLNRAIVEEPK